MKKHTFIKLFLTTTAALCLAAGIFLYIAEQPGHKTQSVSFVVEHFSMENGTQINESAPLFREASAPEDKKSGDDEIAIDDGFDLADKLPPADSYLEKVKDFQADVERTAAQSRKSVPD